MLRTIRQIVLLKTIRQKYNKRNTEIHTDIMRPGIHITKHSRIAKDNKGQFHPIILFS